MTAPEDDWTTLLAEATRELRMPLNAVLGWVQILRTADGDETQRRVALETIERNARLQAQLLDDLLDLARAGAGQLQLRVRAVDPGRAVAQAIDRLRPLGAERGVLVERTVDPRVGPIAADPLRLEQVVRVLALCALRATPDRGVVEILVEAAPDGARVRVGRAGDLGGVARRLVDRLLALHDTKLELTDGVASFALRAASGSTDDAAAPLAGVRIVAVDDEADAREVLRALLEQHGAEVRTAGSVAEALSVLKSWPPDALVSDIGMPDADGYELMLRVRALGQKHGGFVRSVALTAYASEEDARLARHAGFDRHLPKPVDAGQLVRHLVELLAR
ncbi:MAG TPA: response regulator [Polyangia bacterium]|jgi:CheY-like chemotaxis protein